jgi:hypothetical protein
VYCLGGFGQIGAVSRCFLFSLFLILFRPAGFLIIIKITKMSRRKNRMAQNVMRDVFSWASPAGNSTHAAHFQGDLMSGRKTGIEKAEMRTWLLQEDQCVKLNLQML